MLSENPTAPASDSIVDRSLADSAIAPPDFSTTPSAEARVSLVMVLIVTAPLSDTPFDALSAAATDAMSLSLVALAEMPPRPRTTSSSTSVSSPTSSATVSESTVEIATAAPKPALPP